MKTTTSNSSLITFLSSLEKTIIRKNPSETFSFYQGLVTAFIGELVDESTGEISKEMRYEGAQLSTEGKIEICFQILKKI